MTGSSRQSAVRLHHGQASMLFDAACKVIGNEQFVCDALIAEIARKRLRVCVQFVR